MAKDASISQLLSALKLDERGWTVVDHWEADAFAIGIGVATEPRRLVYVSTFKKQAGRYDYECELPTGQEEAEYDAVDRGQDVTYEQLSSVLRQHLS